MYDHAMAMTEGLDSDHHIVATYLIQASADDDHLQYAISAAMEQSVGRASYVSKDLTQYAQEFGGKLVGLFRVPDHLSRVSLPADSRVTTVARIAFPVVNTGKQIPMLLTMLMGDLSFSGMVKLIDIDLPQSFMAAFQGPKYGSTGIRELLAKDRPLICSILKPCVGLNAEKAAEIFYEHALGGADVIKDDELMAYTPEIPIEARVRACTEMIKRAFEESGQRVIYLTSITDRPDRMRENAYRAIEAGATGLMLTPLTTGIGALQMLAEDPSIEVPLFAHPALLGGTSWSPDFGISAHIYAAKLFRLAGADINATQVPYGRFPHLRESYIRTLKLSKAPMGSIKPTFTQVGGGLGAPQVSEVMKDVGNDVMLVLGSSVQRHPMGLAAGVKAVRQAIQAELDGLTHEAAAKKYPEFRAAIEIT